MTEYFQPRGKHCGRKMQILKTYRKKKYSPYSLNFSLNFIVKQKRKLEKACHSEKSKAQPRGEELAKREGGFTLVCPNTCSSRKATFSRLGTLPS